MDTPQLTTITGQKYGKERLQFLLQVVPSHLVAVVEELDGTNKQRVLTTQEARTLKLASSVADLSHNNQAITKAFIACPDVSSVRDIARHYGPKKLTNLLNTDPKGSGDIKLTSIPSETLVVPEVNATSSTLPAPNLIAPDNTNAQEVPQNVRKFFTKLFHQEPSAMIARMINDGEISVSVKPTIKKITTVQPGVTAPGALNLAVPPAFGLDATPAMTPESTPGASPNINPGTDVLPDKAVPDGVVKFFDNNQTFNIRQKSLLEILKDPKALAGVSKDAQSEVVHTLKVLQRTQALTNTPDALPALIKLGLSSAFTVAQIPEKNFISNFGKRLGGAEVARDIHVHATNTVIRNDHALISILQTARGSGVAMIDGPESRVTRINKVKRAVASLPEQPTLERLFGNMDICECDDCNSVTSPAAYFVECLQFLRNNNLNPTPPWRNLDGSGPTGQQGISGTPLEVLFSRRPDLGQLELTCANTNTVLPYIDLANEVMESFIVHLREFDTAGTVKIDVWNAETNLEGLGGSSAELLATPQHINYDAYCILKNAIYPPTKLPFNQPVEAIRLFLDFLGTSLVDLGERFRGKYTPPTSTVVDPSTACDPPTKTPPRPPHGYSSDDETSCDSGSDDGPNGYSDKIKKNHPKGSKKLLGVPISTQCQKRLQELHTVALDRSNDAESLLISEEEYIILTKEAFWIKEHFSIRHGTDFSVAVYQEKIGLKATYAYWGIDYKSEADMLNQDDNLQLGLSFVKAQFLPRAGIQYSELVDLVKTEFINSYLPKGRDMLIMETFRSSYLFLQQKIVPSVCKAESFNKLVDYLFSPGWRSALEAYGANDVTLLFDFPKIGKACRIHHCWDCECRRKKLLRKWLCENFDNMGKVIVLESLLSQARLSFEADIVVPNSDHFSEIKGRLLKDGRIVAFENETVDPTKVIATVSLNGEVVMLDGNKKWAELFPNNNTLVVRIDKHEEVLGSIDKDSILVITADNGPVRWVGQTDDCNLSRVRLLQLNGKQVEPKDFDRMHRFLRLWRKLGWSMVEVDAALRVLGKPPPIVPPSQSTPPGDSGSNSTNSVADDVDWIDFRDSCQSGNCGEPTCKKCSLKSGGTEKQGERKRHECHKQCHCRHCCSCKSKSIVLADISPSLIHQLVALKKLLDITGLPILNLLAFWGHIDTYSSPSPYAQLFLTHNLLGLDGIFRADADGNYLVASPPALISDHIPVLLAAFQLKPVDFIKFRTQTRSTISNDLTLENVSAIYRYSLLSKILGAKIYAIDETCASLGIVPWESAQKALDLVNLWNKISDTGFSFQQLNYVFTGADDPLRPVGPSQRSMLQAAVSLYKGLNDIDSQHPDISTQLEATSSAVLTNVQLIFAPDVSAKIVGFLEGKYTFVTNAPKGLIVIIPPELQAKLKYADGEKPTVQVTGQLTDGEKAKAKSVSVSADWPGAIDRTSRQAATFLKTAFSGIFPPEVDTATKAALLIGDIPASTDSSPDHDTAPGKRLYFLKYFVPFLRRKLADKLVVDTMSTAASLEPLFMEDLLTNIIKDPLSPKISAIEALKKIKEGKPNAQNHWTGWLIPPTTDNYTFVAESIVNPPAMELDGSFIPFDVHSADDDPSNLWASPSPVRLIGGRLYKVTLSGITSDQLSWKTDSIQLSTISASAILADYVTTAVNRLFVVIFKCAILISGFSLTDEEIMYFHTHSKDFSKFDWNTVGLDQWNRIADYIKLRNSLPKLGSTLINFFTWANGPNASAASLPSQLYGVTLWPEDDVKSLVAAKNFDLTDPLKFTNEINFLKLQKALDTSTRIGMGIDLLFDWAKPRIDFWASCAVAESIRVSIRARHKLSDWEVAIKPVYDKLRQMQSDALVAYLLVQPKLLQARVVDADSLFEFFLIDVQMCPCMETSRMKQATSTVQLFIQRCMLGLETDNGVNIAALDRGRWEWMQRYRVWEANRKVFLYPENWIQPSLRDDKSPIYLQLESELLQKDLNNDTVLDAMKNYLFGLSEIANLEVDAIHIQDDETAEFGASRIHIFGRTRHSPYKFYYRSYDIKMKSWDPWQAMQVDIPYYEVEKGTKVGGAPNPGQGPDPIQGGNVEGPPVQARPGGFYLIPFTFNGRLLVAIPQFMKRQIPSPVAKKKFKDIAEDQAPDSLPQEYWEIKMGLSELRKGKWTPKQMTSDSIEEASPIPLVLPPIGSFQFISRKKFVGSELQEVAIDAYRLVDILTSDLDTTSIPIGRFSFSGLQMGKDNSGPVNTPDLTPWTDFQFQRDRSTPANIHTFRVMLPLQSAALVHQLEHTNDALVKYPITETDRTSWITYDRKEPERFWHPFVDSLLSRVGKTDNLDDLFNYFQIFDPRSPDADVKSLALDVYGGKGASDTSITTAAYNELNRPYSLYDWEIGFHAPMTLVDRLLQNQQFDLALKVCHYVFNPLAPGALGDSQRYWAWRPFKDTDAIDTLDKLFDSLRPNTPDAANGQINKWRNRPFQPHVVARDRPASYMKWVVMKYINILIAYGDYFFRQNTLELIPMAIQYYVLASHIYGPPGRKIPKRGKKAAQSYNLLLNNWDAFDNAMVQLELSFPFSNQIDTTVGSAQGVVGLPNIFGFATSFYFCVPDNPDLRALRSTIDDRLFKIRHCQDITGVERKLPLYEPPIDPGLLVQAAANGLSLANVLNDLNSPLPNYRFTHLLKKALEMCGHVKTLGLAFLTAKERKDCEAMLALRSSHHGVVQTLVKEQKKLAVDESQKALDALHQTRKQPEYSMRHNLQLIGEDIGKIPDIGDVASEFNELVDQIEAPLVDSGMKLIASEKEEIEKAIGALDLKPIINAIELAASELHILPTLNGHASPFGVGIASCWGPPNIAKGLAGAAKAYQMVSEFMAHQSANVSRRGTFVKQNQVRQKQANEQGHAIKAIDKQIITHEVKMAVAQQELTNQEQEITHTQEIEDFLKDKYTRTELYQWMEQSVSSIYYQTYTIAYDWAKKAEMAYRFERGLQDANFIKFGYWETANNGLLSGERLFMGLKNLEAAYHESKGYDFEINKFVSLRSINPLALLKLREDASCDFGIPEVLFDMDFPGHYQRRLRSAAITVRCDIAPFTNINCTLRMQSHKYRKDAKAGNKADYPEMTDQDDLRFLTTNVPISVIAVSTGQNDGGVFELDFVDERYMPFEGAGAISTWHLELPDVFRQFDYQTISDVVVHLQYTSVNGGKSLATVASGSVSDYIKSIVDVSDTEGLYAMFDIPHDFPVEWAAVTGPSIPSPRVLTIKNINQKLPVYTKGRAPEKIVTKDVWVVSDASITPGAISFTAGANTLTFTGAEQAAGTKLHAVHSSDPCTFGTWSLGLGDIVMQMKQFWILARYSLK